jgi:plastocyanin
VPLALVLVACLVLGGGGPAGARTPVAADPSPPPDGVHVVVSDNLFTPTVVRLPRGGSIVWDWVGPSHHTATDTTGMGLFDVAAAAGDPSAWFTYVASGSYSYYCVLHTWMGGRVSVPMRAAPRQAGVHHAFRLTWASADAPSGSVYDVQVRRPGGTWRRLVDGTSVRQGSFEPDAGRGTYRVRARMRSVAGSGAAKWSPPVAIQAGPA